MRIGVIGRKEEEQSEVRMNDSRIPPPPQKIFEVKNNSTSIDL